MVVGEESGYRDSASTGQIEHDDLIIRLHRCAEIHAKHSLAGSLFERKSLLYVQSEGERVLGSVLLASSEDKKTGAT